MKIWEKDKGYLTLRKYVDLMTRLSFHHVTVEGRGNIPRDGAVLLVPNHCNTLMDALVVLQARKKETAFGARADMFRKPIFAAVLRWLRILPLARMRDGYESLKENHRIFDEITDCLGHKVPFCLFAEGTHHVGYKVHPVKNGIFHIAQKAVDSLPYKVYIQPVGLEYSDFYHFRNNVTMRYGKAIDARDMLSLSHKDRAEKLTSMIQELVQEGRTPKGSTSFWKKAAAIVLLPVLALCAVAGILVWLPAELIVARLKDKAWSNTVRYCASLVGIPVSVILCAVFGLKLLSAPLAVCLVVLTAVSPMVFYEILSLIQKNL